MTAVLRLEDVTKRYGDVTVLDRVSFEMEPGTVRLLSGRSGSGKSTLFKLLAGLDRPTGGRITIEGTDIGELDDDALADIRLRRMGIVFQSFNLLPDLTAFENVRLPLDLAGIPRRDADARAHELLDLVGVAHRAKAKPNILSGGEQQRVAVARALTNRPALLIADEPTGNLDRKNADGVFELFRSLSRNMGTTILIITHDELAQHWFDDRLLLVDGRILTSASGPASSPAPANPTQPSPRR